MATFRSKNKPLRTFKASKRSVPTGLHSMQVASLAGDGRGVAKSDGKTVFVSGALPGETVKVQYKATHKKFDEADCTHIIEASSERTEPLCQYYQECGGCNLQHLAYEGQRDFKQQHLQYQVDKLLSGLGHSPVETSAPIFYSAYHYRHRARLSVNVNKQSSAIGFKKPSSHNIIDIESCQVLYPSLSELLPPIRHSLFRLKALSSVEQLILLEDDVGKVFVQLLTKRPLPQPDLTELEKLASKKLTVECLLISTDQSYWRSQPLAPTYKLETFDLTLSFAISDFTQVNPKINQQMVERACDWLTLADSDVVVDFFCGVGNFSLPLATCVQKVIGYEMSGSMVEKCGANAKTNQLANIEFVVSDLFQQNLSKKMVFNKALIDPPRAGAEYLCTQLAKLDLDCVVYVSCNPATFLRDAKILIEGGYRLEKISLIDMFPQTEHIELITLFCKV